MMADVIGVPVVASAVPEASSRGAALLALKSLGHISDFGDAPATFGSVYEPDAANHERYKRGRERQERKRISDPLGSAERQPDQLDHSQR